MGVNAAERVAFPTIDPDVADPLFMGAHPMAHRRAGIVDASDQARLEDGSE
jgi:hypothetical protein